MGFDARDWRATTEPPLERTRRFGYRLQRTPHRVLQPEHPVTELYKVRRSKPNSRISEHNGRRGCCNRQPVGGRCDPPNPSAAWANPNLMARLSAMPLRHSLVARFD